MYSGIGPDIVDVDGAPLEGGARRAPLPRPGAMGFCSMNALSSGGGVVGGHDPQQLAVEAEDQRALGLAQPDRVLGQRLEDRLEIERGPRRSP